MCKQSRHIASFALCIQCVQIIEFEVEPEELFSYEVIGGNSVVLILGVDGRYYSDKRLVGICGFLWGPIGGIVDVKLRL